MISAFPFPLFSSKQFRWRVSVCSRSRGRNCVSAAIRCSDFPRTQHTFKRINNNRGGTHSLTVAAVKNERKRRTKIRRACARRVRFSSFLELLRPFFWWVGRVFHRNTSRQQQQVECRAFTFTPLHALITIPCDTIYEILL